MFLKINTGSQNSYDKNCVENFVQKKFRIVSFFCHNFDVAGYKW